MAAAELVPGAVRRWPRRVVIGTCIFLSVVLVVAGGGYVYLRWRLGQIHRVKLPGLADDKGPVVNVLLVGSDSRARLSGDLAQQAGKSQVSGERSDTIMVLHIDSRARKAAILSIPRDLYVPIAGSTRSDRVNTSFSVGGADGLVRTVQGALNVKINHYMEVDFVGFRDIVNIVGGVKMYVPAPARDAFSGLDIKNPGCISLNGDQALSWVRSRHYQYFESGRWREDPRSDLGRIQRQQDFIRRMMKKATSSGLTNPLRLNRLVGIGVKDVTMDSSMSTSDIVRVAKRFRSLNPDTVDMLTLPTTPVTVGGADVLRLNRAEAQPFIDRLNGAEAPSSGGGQVRPGDVRVRVLNGTGAEGAAARAGDALQGAGYNVADKGDANAFTYSRSVIRYATGQRAKAQLLQRSIQANPTVQEDRTLRTVDVALVVGSDFSGVRSTPSPAPTAEGSSPTTVAGKPGAAPPATPAPKGGPAQSC